MLPWAIWPTVRRSWAARPRGAPALRTMSEARRRRFICQERLKDGSLLALGSCQPTGREMPRKGLLSHLIPTRRGRRLVLLEPRTPHRTIGEHLAELHTGLIEGIDAVPDPGE